MMAFDSRSAPEPRSISPATRAALEASVVQLWEEPAHWPGAEGAAGRPPLSQALVAAIAQMVGEAQSRALRAEELLVAFKELLASIPELATPERRLEAAAFRERLITECIRAYYAR